MEVGPQMLGGTWIDKAGAGLGTVKQAGKLAAVEGTARWPAPEPKQAARPAQAGGSSVASTECPPDLEGKLELPGLLEGGVGLAQRRDDLLLVLVHRLANVLQGGRGGGRLG
jgi:hypothetical protein